MSKISVREAINSAIAEEMHNDKNVFILGEEVAEYQGAYKVTQGLLQEFGPKRVMDTPITEHAFTGIGIGAAFNGLRPIVEFMTFNFAMQAIDQIVNSAAKTYYMSGGNLRCPIVFRGPNGSAAGTAAQHTQNYASWYTNVPGLKVISPYFAEDFKGLLKSAIHDPGPVIFLEHELLYNDTFDVPKEIDPIEIGKARIAKSGNDVTLISFSFQMKYVLEAAVKLSDIGIDAEVIDLRTLKPLDKESIISSMQKTNRVVIVEEGWFYSGVGATIATIIMQNAFDYLDAPVEVISSKDVPMPYAQNLEAAAQPSVNEIIEAVKKVCYKN